MNILPNDEKLKYHPLPRGTYLKPISTCYIASLFSQCSDFETRALSFGLEGKLLLGLCWLDGLVSSTDVSNSVVRPLTDFARSCGSSDETQALELIIQGGVYSCSVKRCDKTDELIAALSHGSCALIFDTLCCALLFEVRSSSVRNVAEPTLEKSLKGGKDSFTETLRVNTALVRRRLATPALKCIESTVGRKSRTRLAVLYIDGVADPQTVEELARRLDGMDIDSLLSLGPIEELICDRPRSPFPQLIHTERPDRFAMYLSDGRIGLIADGIPVGIVLPVTLAQFMRVIGDSNIHSIAATCLTLLRYGALLLALLLPAFYVAIAMYHQEMIPTKLLLSVIDAKSGVPFSTALEIIGLLLSFAFLQEAGLRLPDPIGDTVSIIGALIVGQSAVDASLVSPIAIIVVALSGIACYTLPSQDLGWAVRLCRAGLLAGAIVAGLFGVAAVSCLMLLHLSDIDSFGVNYTAPLTDELPFGLFRLLFCRPYSMRKRRDPELKTPDIRRQK